MRFTFDSNILVYAYDRNDAPKRALSQDLVRRSVGRGCVLTVQSLCEFYAVVTRKALTEPARARRAVSRWRKAFPVVGAGGQHVDAAIGASLEHGLQFWDALLWATAEGAGCDIVFSEDFQDGRQLGHVQFINPFREKNRVLLDAALPPVE